MMKKSTLIIVVLALVAIAIILCFLYYAKKPEEIKIGVILPLTGDAAVYGQELKHGIDLAIDEVNSKCRLVVYTGGVEKRINCGVYELVS